MNVKLKQLVAQAALALTPRIFRIHVSVKPVMSEVVKLHHAQVSSFFLSVAKMRNETVALKVAIPWFKGCGFESLCEDFSCLHLNFRCF